MCVPSSGHSTRSILHYICRILVLVALVVTVSSVVIIKYYITIPVQTNVQKFTHAADALAESSISSKASTAAAADRGGFISEGAFNVTSWINSSVTEEKQILVNRSKAETSTIGLAQETKHDFDGMFLQATSEADLIAVREMTRFVLFLCDSSYFSGSVALISSLAESITSTSLPPLVMVMGNSTIRPFEQEILEALGAQVKMVDQPQELADAIALRSSSFQERWQGVFSKILLFRRDIVECDIVFYIDIDSLARGDLMACMYDIIQNFRSKPELDFLAVGSRTYFNNGVMLARPRDTTFSYLVEMLRNGTCVGSCVTSDYATTMRREIYTDQDIFIEYSERYPERFEPVEKRSRLNYRPMYQPNDAHQNCSVVHYVGKPKPWEAWFSIPGIGVAVHGSALPMLPNSIPESMHALKKRSKRWSMPDWALDLWRDHWNHAVTRLQAHAQMT